MTSRRPYQCTKPFLPELNSIFPPTSFQGLSLSPAPQSERRRETLGTRLYFQLHPLYEGTERHTYKVYLTLRTLVICALYSFDTIYVLIVLLKKSFQQVTLILLNLIRTILSESVVALETAEENFKLGYSTNERKASSV